MNVRGSSEKKKGKNRKKRKRKRRRKRQSSKKESFLCPLLFSDTDNERKRQTEWTKLGKVLRGGVQSVQLCLLADTQKTVLDRKRSHSKKRSGAMYNSSVQQQQHQQQHLDSIHHDQICERKVVSAWLVEQCSVCHCQPDHTTAEFTCSNNDKNNKSRNKKKKTGHSKNTAEPQTELAGWPQTWCATLSSL